MQDRPPGSRSSMANVEQQMHAVADHAEGTTPPSTATETSFPNYGEYVAVGRVLHTEAEREPNVPIARALLTPNDVKQEDRVWRATEPQATGGYGRAPMRSLGGVEPYYGHVVQEFGVAGVDQSLETGQQRINEHGRLSHSAPRWYDVLKTAVLQHCYGSDFHYLSRVPDVTQEDVLDFVASTKPPQYLTPQQKSLLSELLHNVESWWSSSFDAMQGIHEESSAIMGFNALPIPPSPLPLQIQRRLKILVRAIMHLLSLPTATAPAMNEDGAQPIEDVQFWKMLGQEYQQNPKMVLKEWLFQRFDRPYPTDRDKKLLAAVTGMTKTQVSNWFINARVRIWQPLVMELGRELCGEHEMAEDPPIDGQQVDVDAYDSEHAEDGNEHSNDAAMDVNLSDDCRH